MNPLDDPRPLLDRALDQAGWLVAAVEPGQTALPTPCSEFDVATLVGHLFTVVARIAVAGRGGDPRELPLVTTGVPFDGWAERYTKAVAELRAVWSDDTLLDRPLQLPWAVLPGRVAAAAYTQELTTHAWDLAVATGRTDGLDPELAAISLEIARRAVPIEGREEMPFGPVVEVPADADAYRRLAGYLGRVVS
jgi:uncharacterized protein (TIGR03086 family)